jgi:hypothetical protein
MRPSGKDDFLLLMAMASVKEVARKKYAGYKNQQ